MRLIGQECTRGDTLSGLILMYRGLNHKQYETEGIWFWEIDPNRSSVDGKEATPVPIPNTAVKLFSADGSAIVRE